MKAYRTPILILLIAWAIMLIRLDQPWYGLGDENGTWISVTVRNLQVYGAAELRFMQVKNYGPATPETYQYYTHHPPLMPWAMAASAAIFGFTEFSMRFATVGATLISTAALYVVARRLFGMRQALWAMAFYAFTPMMLYYGRMPDHEAMALAFTLTFMAIFINWLRQPTQARFIGMVILSLLAAWTAWATLIFIGLAGLLAMWRGNNSQRRDVILLGVLLMLSIVVMLAYYQSVRPDTIQDLLETYLWRVSSQSSSQGSDSFTLSEYFTRQSIHMITLMTPGLLILTLIGALMMRGRAGGMSKQIALVLLVAALAYVLLFRNAAYIHDYYKIYFSPALAVIASYAMVNYKRSRFAVWRRVGAAITGGLLLSSVVTGGVFLDLLHQSSNRDYLNTMRDMIITETAPDDLILTNTDYGIPAIAYYTFRTMDRNITPEHALELAQGRRVFYIYCDREVALPEILEGTNYIEEDMCLYMWLE